VAAVVLASWEKELDWDTFHAELGRGRPLPATAAAGAADGPPLALPEPE
jgi:hypothetical protein